MPTRACGRSQPAAAHTETTTITHRANRALPMPCLKDTGHRARRHGNGGRAFQTGPGVRRDTVAAGFSRGGARHAARSARPFVRPRPSVVLLALAAAPVAAAVPLGPLVSPLRNPTADVHVAARLARETRRHGEVVFTFDDG